MESFRLIWQFFAPLKRTTTIDFTIEMEPLKAPIRHLNRLLRWIEREWNFSYVFNLQHNKKDSGLMVIIFSYIFVKLKVVTSKIHHQSAEKKPAAAYMAPPAPAAFNCWQARISNQVLACKAFH